MIYLKSSVLTLLDLLMYIFYKVTGRPYAEYYGKRMDLRVRLNPSWGLNLNREFQLAYLQAKGMRPHHKLLDYGCGALSAGVHFVNYLDKGCYLGVDVSRSVLEEGARRIALGGLNDKAAELRHIHGGDMANVPRSKYDFLWAQSVLTHMSLKDIGFMFSQLREFMDSDSFIYFTFALSPDGPRHRQFKDWYYDLDTIKGIALDYGLRVELQNDWVHPDDGIGCDTMVRASLIEGRA